MRIKIIILTLLFLFFGASPVFAATIEPPTNVNSEIIINQSYSFNAALTGLQSSEVYFVKCRIGPSSSSLTEGQTYNSITDTWLSDTGSWIDMPTVTATDSNINFSIQCRMKSDSIEGQKIIYTRACLKKSDGTCGTSFQSSSGTNFTAIASTTPAPTPTPTPDPTSTPTPTTTSSSTSSSFIISNVPSSINADQSFSVTVNLSLPNNQNSDYFLKGAFKIKDGTRYLGLTKVNGDWVEYGDENSDQYKITTDASGNWSGNLEVKPDTNDQDYKGTGDYIFKVGRYTSSSLASYSNEQTIHITDNQSIPTSTSTSTPKPSSTPTSSTSTKAATSFATPLVSDTNTPQLPILGLSTSSAEASAEAYADFKQTKTPGIAMITGGLIIIAGAAGTYLRYKRTHVQS